jgi:predicted metal-dependent hydrolase
LNILTPLAIPYQLRHSARAKHLRIVIKPGLVEVVAPLKTPEAQIKAFVHAQQTWIKTTLQRIAEQIKDTPIFSPTHYTNGASVPYQGQQLNLQLKYHLSPSIRIQLDAQTGFIVTLPASAPIDQQSELIKHALTRWMKKQARLQASELIAKYEQILKLYSRSLRIKTLSSRWGSCGPLNDINLNWLLLLAPPAALEYVVIHELCHIKHKNHSKDFWNLVANYCPDYQQQRNWLKQNGASLMRGL